MTLYGNGRSRWVKPYWTLKELNVDFRQETIRPTKILDEHPEFLKINPFAKIPALLDGDFVLTESAAICTYLADKYPEKSLIPRVGTRERALHDQWISFMISDLEQPLWRITRHMFIYPDVKRSTDDIELAKADFAKLCKVLEEQISDYLVSDTFSVADISMTYTLNWAKGFGLLPVGSKLEAYAALHSSRERFPRELYA